MENKVTVVVYHYVRDLKNSRFPEIKGLELYTFKKQISYFLKTYNFISMEDLISAAYDRSHLPQNALLLTFDDGYIDHYTNVFPILENNGIKGAFFVPGKLISETKILNVNKIHILLASLSAKTLVGDIFIELDNYKNDFDLETNEYYYHKFAIANRFDDADTIFVKRFLQHGLHENLRDSIINSLFTKHIHFDHEELFKELYLKPEHMIKMMNSGMHIGSHGYSHNWLNTLSKDAAQNDIEKSLEIFNNIGMKTENWTMCYPYGGYNDETLEIIKRLNCKLGFTIISGKADLLKDNLFTLPRIDAVDFINNL